MDKKSIIIIIVCTLIFIAISLATVYREPAIEDTYISSEKIFSEEQLAALEPEPSFSSGQESVYLIMSVKYISPKNEISVAWEKYNDNETLLVQQNTIHPQEKGSGFILVSLAKRNNSLSPGKYRVRISLDNQVEFIKNFVVN